MEHRWFKDFDFDALISRKMEVPKSESGKWEVRFYTSEFYYFKSFKYLN